MLFKLTNAGIKGNLHQYVEWLKKEADLHIKRDSFYKNYNTEEMIETIVYGYYVEINRIEDLNVMDWVMTNRLGKKYKGIIFKYNDMSVPELKIYDDYIE